MSAIQKFVNINYKIHIILSLVLRFILIGYGIYHDQNSSVKYTDVDYKVFTDASRHILNNGSPYNRHTYRYSPILAGLLIPNIILHPCFGKVLFCIIDVIVGLLIRKIVKHNLHEYDVYVKKTQSSNSNQKKLKYKNKNRQKNVEVIDRTSNISMLCWLYNPMTIAIGTRGNCDSLAGFFVLLTLYFLQCKGQVFAAGLIHGLSIHFRVYPIIYSLTMYMSLSKFSFYTTEDRRLKRNSKLPAIDNKGQSINEQSLGNKHSNSLAAYNHNERKTIFKKEYLLYLVPNWNQLKLVAGCILSLTLLTGTFYLIYGYKFLYEAYIFHFTRQDTRHNFSLYFYLLYLTAWVKNIGIWQKVLIVFPQLLLLIVFSFRYGLNKFSLNFGILVQTIVMVIYNTVLTSQYFVWVMAILPLCLWQIKISVKSAILLLVVWFIAQGAWLLPAYYLEFQGQNTFILIWIQSVSLFCANIAILGRMIMYFMPVEKPKSE